MNFLNSFTIRTRIIILVIIPLIVTMALSVERYQHASDKNEVALELELLLNYIAKTSPIITGMQKETGLSRVWLSKKKPMDKSQLDSARAPINIAISDYQNFVESNKNRLDKFNLLSERIEDVQKRLELFKTVRMLVDQQKKSSKEHSNLKNENIWTLGEMEKLTASLILSTSAVVKLASADQALSLMTNAYYNLIQALNSNVIAITAMKPVITGYLRIYNYGVIIKNDGIQQAYLKSFESLASDSTLAYYNQHLKETEQFQVIFDTHNNVRDHL
ncbi:MAG: nitrate- and nitrite sensing domain-containing protein, partial [Colwellia sp.]|nr:nitrate- and nitrite sensing domain-containing protein [Colwellia sp.]